MFFHCCFGVGKEDAQEDDAETAEAVPPTRGQEKRKAGEFVLDESSGEVMGIHNSAGKYAPDAEVLRNDESFEQRLERAIRAEEAARLKRTLDF